MPRLLEQPVHLTRDGIWAWAIRPDIGEEWPVGAVAHTRFMNSAGTVVADVEAAEVTGQSIRFLHTDIAALNAIPAGARYETFIQTPDGPVKIRYGTVMRPEAKFFDSPGRTGSTQAKKFADSMQRSAPGSNWEAVHGVTKMYNNTAVGLGYGMGPNTPLFSNTDAAVRWKEQLTGDSVDAALKLTLPQEWGGNNGATCHVICADQTFTTGLAIEFNSVNMTVRFARVTSPTTVVYLGPAVPENIVDHNTYRVRYNHLIRTLSLYKGTNLAPMIPDWVDTDEIIPHGNGYRHTGFMFKPTFLDTGPQVSGWAAMDTV